MADTRTQIANFGASCTVAGALHSVLLSLAGLDLTDDSFSTIEPLVAELIEDVADVFMQVAVLTTDQLEAVAPLEAADDDAS